jgi:imidazolonepropionase-like amidohydrolase
MRLLFRTPTLVALVAVLAFAQMPSAQQPAPTRLHGRYAKRLLIRNAMVIYGNAKPPFGPVDILIEDGLIARVSDRPSAQPVQVDAVIDAAGKYVLPGLVNTHMHWHEERMPGIPQPVQYERNLYLAAGVTTVREVGTDNYARSRQWRDEAAARRIAAPRTLVYQRVDTRDLRTLEQVRAAVRDVKQQGSDGLKIGSHDRDQLETLLDEARKQGLRSAAHIGVEETTAKDYIELGVTSIEHFYGVGDAAIDGLQNFPPDMNYSNEVHRFARAGELYAQAHPEKLRNIIDMMVERQVAWSPTLSIYEASRDLMRAQNLPWFKDYLHPSMEEFWKPNLKRHGSFFIGWTSTQEARWRQNYRIWMQALRDFGVKGGLITTGDDAGYIYSLYGFGLIRELELHEEAGFHPLEVLKHATANGAKLLGLEDRIGRVRVGYIGDLIVVNGNPLENLRLLNPAGTEMNVNGQNVHGGGIEWTIKEGTPYHGPTLMQEVRDLVAKARSDRVRQTTP